MGLPGPVMRRLHPAALLLALAVAFGAISPASVLASTGDRIAASARDPHWLALLHQARHRPSRAARKSLTESGFYLHPEGARDPASELAATLAAMTSSDAKAAQTARCRLPARHAFLAEQGLVDAERGACPRFDEWRTAIGTVRATIVFPEAFLGNPSSMFGHTLLRFDPVDAEGGARTPLLGWTLDYMAHPGEDRGPLFLVRGLVGGYLGRFGIAPYYAKTRFYGDWQDRDIWEYPLALETEEVDRILLHVWELETVALPYVFFTRNCSEYLLDVLEIAWPGLDRAGGFPPAVTPIDTLRAMEARAPGSVGTPYLRASPATKLQAALANLAPEDGALVEALATGSVPPDDPRVTARPESLRGRILAIAYDLAYHRTTARNQPSMAERERLADLLRARSRLGARPNEQERIETRDRVDPLGGHGTARTEIAAGVDEGEAFVEWRLQPAYHEAIDAPDGFAEGGEIRFLDTRLRYYPEHERVRLQEFTVVDVSTASPWRAPFRPLAWHAGLGLQTRRLSDDDGSGLEPESLFRFQGGVGAAAAPLERLHLYAFGEVVVEAGRGLEGNGAAGPVARLGGSWTSRGGGTTLRAEAIAGGLFGRDASEWLRIEVEQRVTLTDEWSVTWGGHFDRAYGVGAYEGRASFIRYF
ncbi:MAG: DUF4105 domain-containing protein [bacterium]|nr:DUF4105 domain-containing protein [bacterium]